MPSPPKSRRKAGRTVRHTLKDGTVKIYQYERHAPKATARTADSTAELIAAYQRSPEWSALAESTRTGYTIYMRPLFTLGHLSAASWTRRDILTLRDAIASSRGNGAATGFIRAASALFNPPPRRAPPWSHRAPSICRRRPTDALFARCLPCLPLGERLFWPGFCTLSAVSVSRRDLFYARHRGLDPARGTQHPVCKETLRSDPRILATPALQNHSARLKYPAFSQGPDDMAQEPSLIAAKPLARAFFAALDTLPQPPRLSVAQTAFEVFTGALNAAPEPRHQAVAAAVHAPTRPARANAPAKTETKAAPVRRARKASSEGRAVRAKTPRAAAPQAQPGNGAATAA